jgi:hypothetical protein
VLEVVVGNGPFAGTYKPPVAEIVCMHAKNQRVVEEFQPARPACDVRGRTERVQSRRSGCQVRRRARRDPDKKPVVYDLSQVPMTLKTRGKGADLAFEGRTKDGVALRISAQCNEVEDM